MRILFILFIFYIPLQSILSETLVLKDGAIIKMTLKAQDVDTLTYTLKGKEFKVPKGKIRRVVYAKTPELEEKIAKEEVQKMKLEKASKKPTKTNEEELEEAKLLEEEIVKALEEQRKQDLLNLSFEERIHKLEKEVSELKSLSSENAATKIARMEEDISELKKQARRIEKFLDIDPDIEDYYAKPRTMWSIVWRSALVPGWGLSYGRSNFSTLYSSLFFVSAIAGVGAQEGLKSTDKSLDNKFLNDFIVQPYALSILLTSSSTTQASASTITTDLARLQSFNNTTKLVKYYQSRENYQGNVEKSQQILAFAAGIYTLQLIHSAVYGYFWAKRTPKKFNDDKSTGWNIQISPLAKRNPITNNQDWQMDFGYRIEF